MASADGRTGRGAVDALVRVRTAGRAAHAAVSATATGTALASLSAVRALAALATVRALASLASFGVRATALATGRSRSAWRVRNGNVRRGLRCGRDGG